MRSSPNKKFDFEQHAAQAFAVMWNTLDLSVLEPLLARNVRYESSIVMLPVEGKDEVLQYLATIIDGVSQGLPASRPFAELGSHNDHPCVLLAQGSRKPPSVVVKLEVGNDLIKRICLYTSAPCPHEVERTGLYPTELPGDDTGT